MTDHIPEPFRFNPLKHHLEHLRMFIDGTQEGRTAAAEIAALEMKRAGSSVMDIYTGSLDVRTILGEARVILETNGLGSEKTFSAWTGKNYDDFRIIILSDSSQWILKYHDDRKRYIHIFPARSGPYSIRVKANTLKSAIMYIIFIGRDYITRDDLNLTRKMLGLSPVKGTSEAEAITRMIELLRSRV